MTFFEILSTLLIGPLKLLFEVIFVIANRFLESPGLSILVLSLIMNFLVLPLYRRADAMQEAARDTEAKLQKGVAHIKKAFTGDERMMVLQTYYRQNNYKPTDALRGSVSLLLEIPFFMAAYQFLSGLQTLQQVSFGPIADLSVPDGLLTLGGFTINVLPVLMTLINVISSAIYLKGFPMKTKVQLYAMAAFFLVFLYDSPSGLVFYWTLNNLFSLVKTICYKLKNPKKVLSILSFGIGLVVTAFALVIGPRDHPKLLLLIVALGLAMMCPQAMRLLRIPAFRLRHGESVQPNRNHFILACLFLTLLVGVLIPTNFIAASPQEYVDITDFYHPLWYVVSATALAAGTFLVWFGVFYWLASPVGKVWFERLACIACVAMLVNYMFFGTDLGILSAQLRYDFSPRFTTMEQLLNLGVMAGIALGVYFLCVRFSRAAGSALLTAVIALGCMSGINIFRISSSIAVTQRQLAASEAEEPTFSLSKTGKNVVVLMLDRALGEMVPYILSEKPEIMTQFDGFTYYSNVITFGGFTNFGTPGLFGGYEYTPVEMNKRDTEPLVEKQNEALKVMPVLFSENGYQVTVCDPPYAGYQWIPDLSIYDDYPEIKAYITEGRFGNGIENRAVYEDLRRNFFCFGIVRTMPIVIQGILYNEGNYNMADYDRQTIESLSTAKGISPDFMRSYQVITNLPAMTRITDNTEGTFLMLANAMTHQPVLLQTPDYTPREYVDNTEYDQAQKDRFVVDGRKLTVVDSRQMSNYHVNMAMFLRLGEWFDELRAQGVYDNTRIILVSDHGTGLACMEELIYPDGMGDELESYYPLLMVKDFDAEGFTTSDAFMTNADVPTLAVQGVIEEPTNPFTGKPINSDEKTAHDQIIILSDAFNLTRNNGNTFLPSRWASVHDDRWNMDNWTFYNEEVVLKEHALP